MPMSPYEARDFEALIATVRGSLGDEAFESAWQDGRRVGVETLLDAVVGAGAA